MAAAIADYTPEFAERESGVPAETIRRLAREFAAAAPACCTMSNRGSAKHYNGVQADRAIRMLDVLVGNVGQPGGFCLSSLRGWKKGRYGHGQVLLLPDADQLLVLAETGELVLLRTDPEKLTELARIEVFDGKTWNHPVLVGDRLYLRNAEEAVGLAVPVG